MKKILFVFGTRPEAIKMAPLIHRFKADPDVFDVKVCITAQHRHMLDQVLDFFNIEVDDDLNLMQKNQTLFDLTAAVLTGLQPVLNRYQPDYLFVHGDTTTTFAASLAGFYAGIKVCHIEAGLRTFNIHSPFPEEINRQLTSRIAHYHFAPTKSAQDNLLKEHIPASNIIVTGNTVIDALLFACKQLNTFESEEITRLKKIISNDQKIILVTGHRRENHGENFKQIFSALKEISKVHPQVHIVFPVHLNPKVKNLAFESLQSCANISLIEPLSYPAFVWLMKQSYFIITDSGGIQEEAPSLGIPVLLTRDTTERPEAILAKTVIMTSSNQNKIIGECKKLLFDSKYYQSIAFAHNPYGDGTASEHIVDFMKTV